MAEQTLAQYLNQFEDTTEELLVRISWVPKEVHPETGRIDNRYKVQARFDAALDPSTGNIVQEGISCTLEWLVQKRLFSDPFGHRFKVGHCYRVLLRRKKDSLTKPAYYLEQVLEKDVYEVCLDPIQRFLDEFEPQEEELIFLNRKKLYGWGIFWGYPRVFLSALAYIDSNNVLHNDITTFAFLSRKNSFAPNREFEALTAYRVKAKRHKTLQDRWLVTALLGKTEHSQLNQFIEDYQKPILLEDSLGTFRLERDMDWYEGHIQWLDGDTEVLLTVEPGRTDASTALETLHKIAQDIPSFDEKCRTYVSENMYDLLLDWYDEEISKDEFKHRIGTPLVLIDSDGEGSLSYDSGELFADHQIVLTFDRGLNPGETDLQG